jgi:hypothetical protein
MAMQREGKWGRGFTGFGWGIDYPRNLTRREPFNFVVVSTRAPPSGTDGSTLFTMPRACCDCQAVIRELQQEVRTLRAELECHVSCSHCGLVYDKRYTMAAEACAATGTTHNDPEFERCEVCQLVVPKATQGFRLGDYLDGVECVHHFHPKAAAVLDEQCLRWPCC